jgi:hypothetical protein
MRYIVYLIENVPGLVIDYKASLSKIIYEPNYGQTLTIYIKAFSIWIKLHTKLATRY